MVGSAGWLPVGSFRRAATGWRRADCLCRPSGGTVASWWCGVLTLSSGHSAEYLTGAVATGRENYYTGAVAAGEPPGRWYGRGAERLGLCGLVDTQDMTALYERYIDPRDDAFRDPVRWDEAATLGHTGRRYLSEDEIYAAALATEPGTDAERRAALRVEAGKRARKNVSFLDATFSVQKSITVLHTAFEAQEVQARSAAERARAALATVGGNTDEAPGAAGALHRTGSGAVHPAHAAYDRGRPTRELADAEAAADAWATYRKAVEDAIWAGNQAALDYLADKAGYARVGHHGGAAGRWIDAHDWTVASFFQHDSRNHDPQLHIHNAILNRVEGADGQWRTLDSKAIHKYRGAASAVGDRVMEQHLTGSLGVEFATRPDGAAREVVGIDQTVTDLFSSRRRAISGKTRTLLQGFEAKFGRAPNALELDRLQRSAAFATRNAKSHDGETVEQRLQRWDTQLRGEVRGGLRAVAEDVLDRRQGGWFGRGPRPRRWREREVIETALADVQATKSAWTAPDLTRAISNALPDYLGQHSPHKIARLLDGLTAKALRLAVPIDAAQPGSTQLPDHLRRADGTSSYEAPGGRLYATPDHLHTERLLSAASVDRGAPAITAGRARHFVAALSGAGLTLGADQATAVSGILTSGAKVESLIGPAGTGKSFVVGVLAKAWQDPDLWSGARHRVVGLATSQIATEVLTGEGLAARNIASWLATQQRLADGRPFGDDKAWRLRTGDLVVVDESAMADTTALAKIHEHCRSADAKILLTGDHRQLAAVGAAGGMELVAAHGVRHELAETRRFTADWEGPASLRLRDRDQSVLSEYHKHGRLIDGGAIEQTEQAAAKAWLADTLAGRHALLIVDSNEQAARLSAQLRADLVRLGRVDEHAVPLGLQGTFAGRGDLIQGRRNAWELAGHDPAKRAPINRQQYRVLEVRADGGLIVAPITGRRDGLEQHGAPMTLPAAYVANDVALGYASTVHAAQGLTVDTCHTVATSGTGAEALYVGLTRGRQNNTAYVATRAVHDTPDGAPTGQALQAVHRSPQAVLAGAFETTDPQLSALATAAESQAEADSARTPAELFADAVEIVTAGRTATWLDQLVTDGHLTDHQRAALAAEDGTATLTTLLRRVELAGHDPRQVLTDAVTSRTLDDARQLTNVVHRRITNTTRLDPIGDTYAERLPRVDDPQWSTYLASLADAADDRQVILGRQVADEAPQWAVEALGAVPAPDDSARGAWENQAGIAAIYRELAGVEDSADALGRAPRSGQVEAYAAYRAAWRSLGRPEADRAEVEMSTGQLRVRVRAYDREQAWAPPYVANELAGSRQAARERRNDAIMRAAEANTAADPVEHDRLRLEADQAAALADALDTRIRELEAVDAARAQWYAHTAETRAAADRARAELSIRQADANPTTDESEVTTDEWIARDQADVATEDPHRVIVNEHELTDVADARENDQRTAHASDAAVAGARDLDQVNEHTAESVAESDRGQLTERLNEPDASRDTVATKPGVDPTAQRDAESVVELVDEPDADQVDQHNAQHDAEHGAEQTTTDTDAEFTAGVAEPDLEPAAPIIEPVADIADEDVDEPAPDQDPADTAWDIRQEAADEPDRDDGHDPDSVRVPSSDETAESVRRAQRALTELKQRQAIEDRHAADEARERDDELANWRDDNTHAAADTADHAHADDHAVPNSEASRSDHVDATVVDDDSPVLEVTRDDY